MKKTMLCLALLGAMGAAQAVMAQDFDDRWYIDGSTGFNFQDNARGNYNSAFGILGVGKMVNPNWSFELNYNYQRPREKSPDIGGHWEQQGLAIDALYHFRTEGRNWNPYMRFGIGWQREKEDFFTVNPNGTLSAFTRKDNSIAFDVGAGLEARYGRYGIRTEIGARYDGDDNSVQAPGKDYFLDLMASVGVTVALGPEPMKAVEPAPMPAPVATCADKDSDGDGVNDCNDKCPNSPAGQTVGPDGCPVPVTIDLRGVNFDFDKSKLRPDAIEILNQAIEVLKKYPELKVEVAGHTDSVGTDAYNQKLSERRADAVRNYLVSKGVPKDKIETLGMGKTQPLPGVVCDQKNLKEKIACYAPDRRVEVEVKGEILIKTN